MSPQVSADFRQCLHPRFRLYKGSALSFSFHTFDRSQHVIDIKSAFYSNEAEAWLSHQCIMFLAAVLCSVYSECISIPWWQQQYYCFPLHSVLQPGANMSCWLYWTEGPSCAQAVSPRPCITCFPAVWPSVSTFTCTYWNIVWLE